MFRDALARDRELCRELGLRQRATLGEDRRDFAPALVGEGGEDRPRQLVVRARGQARAFVR
jgi:hypothetical protein